jgi:hypothetical protein
MIIDYFDECIDFIEEGRREGAVFGSVFNFFSRLLLAKGRDVSYDSVF